MNNHPLYQQHEFERLLKEKGISSNFSKHPDGNYVDEMINLAYTGWCMAKAHTKVQQQKGIRI